MISEAWANETNSRRAMKSCDRELDDVPGQNEANLCLGYPALKIPRLACFLIVARPLAKLEGDISELTINDILRSTANLYNQVAATIFLQRSTDDGHNESSAR